MALPFQRRPPRDLEPDGSTVSRIGLCARTRLEEMKMDG